MPVFTRIARAVAGAGLALALLPAQAFAQAASEPAYGPELEEFTYPEPTQQYRFKSQGVDLQMTYMDVKPAKPNGRTVVLMHGKNFCGATWDGTTKALTQAGYRVVVPDQVGFCKSTKPQHYQYTFQQLADNTRKLLESIGVKKAIVIGHSTGGMLATRYALMYPELTDQLVMINPIGLEDWKSLGVPSLGVDKWYERELKTSAERVREYERTTYYNGQWKPEYEVWVQMLVGMYRGKGKEIVAWNSALIYDMIYTQPVVYEFPLIKVPTFLLMGLKDTTAIGKDAAPAAIRPKLGNYTVLAQKTKEAIPGAKLVTFPEMGHAPQMQDPVKFHKALVDGLVR
ncbi:alpha/beta fold hydrolase [Massilia timonae]|uniref:alpha/beta fold hydrolase n=1 Tax=Massilia timonae TaxID=47229 RepID=UPI0028D71FDF|nr:alpha/beta hydrolase [Massilia timonae]